MARGKRKSIEDKILEKQEQIKALEIRLEKEPNELEALLSEQKLQSLEVVDELIKSSNLTLNEVTDILQQYMPSQNQIAV